jgi:hypothetical protein
MTADRWGNQNEDLITAATEAFSTGSGSGVAAPRPAPATADGDGCRVRCRGGQVGVMMRNGNGVMMRNGGRVPEMSAAALETSQGLLRCSLTDHVLIEQVLLICMALKKQGFAATVPY